MQTIKSIADFKRAVKIGAIVNCIYHHEFNGRDEAGKVIYKDLQREPREVSRVQSNQFALKTTKKDGTTVDSWCNWPKASQAKIEGNRVTILEPDGRIEQDFTGYPNNKENRPLIPILTYWID